MTAREALETIKQVDVTDQIVYFYVVDKEKRLAGVVPLRRLIAADPAQLLEGLMLPDVVSLGESASIEDAYRSFSTYKFLSLPVVNSENRVIGVLDITCLTGYRIDLSNRRNIDDIYETIGIRVATLKFLSPVLSFKYRFPWLIPNVISGTICALLAEVIEKTLEDSIVIAFFLTLVLGVGESVSIQSLTITIRQLHGDRPSLRWYIGSLRREVLSSVLIGAAVGLLIGIIVIIWKQSLLSAVAIGASILLSILSACVIGLSAPTIIHGLRVDPKVAAGPLALAVTDIMTVTIYFSVAAALL